MRLHIVVFAMFSTVFSISHAAECALKRVQIHQIAPERRDVFVGKGERVQLEFNNFSNAAEIEVFPDPPLVVRRLSQKGGACKISGGIWTRKDVFLSKDELTLLVREYSGSNDSLVFYDTRSCKRHDEIDVSNARWSVSGRKVVVGTQCQDEMLESCRSLRRQTLNGACLPAHVAKKQARVRRSEK